jgi:hypothetical protein
MATGQNPPDGAIIDYYVGPKITGDLTLEILDGKGELVARFNSNDPVPELDPLHYPDPILWARLPRALSAAPGEHRFLWDMQYVQIPGISMEPSADEAVPHDTPSSSTAPWAMPGDYTVRLIASGKTLSQPLNVIMDPRVKTPVADLQAQFDLAKSVYDEMLQATTAIHEIDALRKQLKDRSHQSPVASADPSIESKLNAIAGSERRQGGFGGGRRGGPSGPANLGTVRTQLARLEREIENGDVAPTTTQVDGCHSAAQPLSGLLEQWQQLKQTDLKALNEQLRRDHLAALDLDSPTAGSDKEQIDMGDDE